jgi:uncharacterized protein
MPMAVEHREEEKRFVLPTDAGLAVLDYQREDGRIYDLVHTGVPGSERHQGIGGQLVRGALEQLRGQGGRIRPSCPFVRRWIEDHPEFADMVAEPDPGG